MGKDKDKNRSDRPVVRFHDLRHTWATLALRAGVSPKIVSERLGHASVGSRWTRTATPCPAGRLKRQPPSQTSCSGANSLDCFDPLDGHRLGGDRRGPVCIRALGRGDRAMGVGALELTPNSITLSTRSGHRQPLIYTARGWLGCRVGLNLANGSGVPLSHQVVRFDVTVGDWENPLTEVVHREDIAPGQTKGWYRDRRTVSSASLPADVRWPTKFTTDGIGASREGASRACSRSAWPSATDRPPFPLRRTWSLSETSDSPGDSAASPMTSATLSIRCHRTLDSKWTGTLAPVLICSLLGWWRGFTTVVHFGLQTRRIGWSRRLPYAAAQALHYSMSAHRQ